MGRRSAVAFICALFVAGLAHAQVRIDDSNVLLDSGKTLQQAIIDGDFGVGGGSLGNVVGPITSTTGAVPRYANTAGTLLLDSSAADNLALLRSWMETAETIDVDPAEAGSTSAGLQEAFNACNAAAGRCVIQLRADTTYTLPSHTTWTLSGGAYCAVETNGADDWWLRGAPGAQIVYAETANHTTVNKMICVEAGSERWRISGLRIVRTDTCTTSCTAYDELIRVQGSARDGVIEDNVLSTARLAQTDTGYPGPNSFPVHLIATPTTLPADTPKRISIRNNKISAASAGVHWTHCDDCELANNWIDFAGVPDGAPGGVQPTIRALTLFHGRSPRIIGNQIDMSRDGHTDVSWSFCMNLSQDQSLHPGQPASSLVNNGAIIVGNTCSGLRDNEQTGFYFTGYDNALIASNTVIGGVCSNDALKSCTNWQDCDIGSGTPTCDTANVRGVWMSSTNTAGLGGNRGNAIVSNSFIGMQDASGRCPFTFAAAGGLNPTEGQANTFFGNRLGLNDSTADGICGDPTVVGDNHFGPNPVIGAATECIGGQGLGTCALSFTRATGALAATHFVPHTNTFFPTSPVTGEIAVVTDDPSAGACTSAGGAFRSLCQWNGSAWVAL